MRLQAYIRYIFVCLFLSSGLLLAENTEQTSLASDVRWALQNDNFKAQIKFVDGETEGYSESMIRGQSHYRNNERWEFPNTAFRLWKKRIGAISDPAIWQATISSLSSTERRALYSRFELNSVANFGWEEAPISVAPTYFIPYRPAVLETDIMEALTLLLHPSDKVVWDGAAHEHVYHDAPLQDAVRYLASILEDPDGRRNLIHILQRLSPDLKRQLSEDTNTESMTSRIEPADLISKEMYRRAKRNLSEMVDEEEQGTIPISEGILTELAKDSWSRLINDSSRKEAPQPTIFRTASGNEMYAVCPNGDSGFSEPPAGLWISRRYENGVINIQKISFSSDEVSNKKDTEIDWMCGQQKYHLSFAKRPKLGTLPQSENFNLESAWSSNHLNAVASFALTSYVKSETTEGIKRYLATRGYKAVADNEVLDLTNELRDELPRSHVVIISANEPPPGQFRPGFKKSHKFVFEKGVAHPTKPGEKLTIQFSIFTPPILKSGGQIDSNNQLVNMSTVDIANIFCSRRDSLGDSMVVMNLWCKSESAIEGWMRAYKDSLSDRQGKPWTDTTTMKDLPVIIGSTKGFQAESLLEVLEIIEYPLTLIDSIGQNATLEQAMTQVNAPNMFETLRLSKVDDPSKKPRGFRGVCNMNPSYRSLFDLGGEVQVLLRKVGENLDSTGSTTVY